MNREERIKAALNGQEVDRIPVSIWMHFSEVDQDPRMLAEEQINLNEKYDYDFIKLMPFGTYTVQDWGSKIRFYCQKYKEPIIDQFGIKGIKDWSILETLPAYYGTWGKQLQLAQHVSKNIEKNTPFIQTVFSPLTTAKKLAGDRLFHDMKEEPKMIHQALEVITETTINFIKANIEAGVSGFFLATQCATYDLMNDENYEEFGAKYDLELIEAFKDDTYFNVVHIHGENIMFDTVEKYPCNCLNWHDRYTEPNFKEARKKTSKCFLGGIQEVPYFVDGVLKYNSIMSGSSPEQIEKHVLEAVNQIDGKGLIVGPGCVTDPRTKEENLYAVRKAVDLGKVVAVE